MKKNILKTITVLTVVASVSFSSMIYAGDDMALPVISKPAILQEGTQRDLTPVQIAELLPWAKNSKIFLADLLENVQGLPGRDKNERLIEGIKSTVNESAPKNSELLMRYALNRGLVIGEILSKEMDAEAVGSNDVQSRVLIASIQMAIKYYDTDMAVMTKKTPTSFAAFGADYYRFLAELNKSVIDASAQYAIQKTALEWLQWDLYRDLNNASYAPQIVKINNGLKVFPSKNLTDSQSLNYVRQMKKMTAQLNLTIKNGNSKTSQSPESTLKEVLDVGDQVVYTYANTRGVVAGIRNNMYTIKFDDGTYGSDLPRKYLQQRFGCDGNYCVGEDIIFTYSFKEAQIESLSSTGITISFNGKEMQGSTAKYVAKTSGCGPQFCVGDKVIYTYTNSAAVVVGYSVASGNYVIQKSDKSVLVEATTTYLVKNDL